MQSMLENFVGYMLFFLVASGCMTAVGMMTDREDANPPRSFDAEHELGQEIDRRLREVG